MFAFAIWDNEKQELFCARDRFGEKPFYYAIGTIMNLFLPQKSKQSSLQGLSVQKLAIWLFSLPSAWVCKYISEYLRKYSCPSSCSSADLERRQYLRFKILQSSQKRQNHQFIGC
jgi:asparagine synthase (glutamine-hydrolysing)